MMSEPMEFWREIECSGVSNLYSLISILLFQRENRGGGCVSLHRRPIMRTQEPDSLLRNLRQLKQRHHLESDMVVSYGVSKINE